MTGNERNPRGKDPRGFICSRPTPRHLRLLYSAVVVAMSAVGMVQVTVDEIIRVVAVRHRLVAAAGAMFVSLVVAAAIVRRRAGGGIRLVHFEAMLFHLRAAHVVEMAVVQIIDMAIVTNARMPATGSMLVIVAGVSPV